MSPPTEQLVADYLSRLSAAARGKLAPADRRALVMRTRYFIQQTAGQAGIISPIEVAGLLSRLGDPASIVAQEQARLAGLRGEPVLSPAARLPRPGRLLRRQQGQASWHWPSQPAASPQLANSLMAAADDPAAGWQRDPVPTGKLGLLFRRAGRPAGMPGWTVPTTAADGSRQPAQQPPGPRSAADGRQDGAVGGVVPEPASGEAAALAVSADLPGRPTWPSVVARTAAAGDVAGNGTGEPGAPAGSTVWLNGQAVSPGLDESGGQAASGLFEPFRPARTAIGISSLTGILGQLVVWVVGRFRTQPVESGAAVLLGIGGAAYPPVWLLGAALALTSRVWNYRDKWIGLGLPLLVTIIGTVVGVSLTGSNALGHDVHDGWLFADVLSRVAAFAGACYLLWRARHGKRPPAIPPWNKPRKVD